MQTTQTTRQPTTDDHRRHWLEGQQELEHQHQAFLTSREQTSLQRTHQFLAALRSNPPVVPTRYTAAAWGPGSRSRSL